MHRALDRRTIVRSVIMSLGGSACATIAGCSSSNDGQFGTTSALGTAPQTPGTGTAAKSQVKVALLLPLSSAPQTAAIAKAMREAAELAVFDQRNADIQLVIKDDHGTEAGAAAAAKEAIDAGAEMILGPIFSKSARAVAGVARKANVPVVTFSNDPSVGGNGVYLMSFSPAVEVARVVSFAGRSGRRTFGALIPDDAEGKILEPAMRAAVQQAGGSVAFVEKYKFEENGLISTSPELRDRIQTAMRGEPPLDALFLPGGQDTLPQLSALVLQAGLDLQKVKLLGTSGWDYQTLQLTSRLHGGWFAAPDPRGWSDFAERYGRAYKSMPPRLASLSHDAVALAGTLAGGAKGSRFTHATITRTSGFSGADGHFRFTSQGIAERGLAILEAQKAGPVVVDRPSSGELSSPAIVSLAAPEPRPGTN